MTYPRDMVGYGRTPPQANWPNGAKLALQFIVAFEEGSENCILHGDAHSENFISDIMGAPQLFGVRNMNMESLYEYGTRVAFWRVFDEFKQRGISTTVLANGLALQHYPEAGKIMHSLGHEIAMPCLMPPKCEAICLVHENGVSKAHDHGTAMWLYVRSEPQTS